MVVEEFDLLSVAQLFCFSLVDGLFSLSRDIFTVGTSLRYMAQMFISLIKLGRVYEKLKHLKETVHDF